jgi:hypothetical protein
MHEEICNFCDEVHGKLSTLQSRIDCLKRNVGTNRYLLNEKLESVRKRRAAAVQAVSEARTELEQCVLSTNLESKQMVRKWIEERDSVRLLNRAKNSERCALLAIAIAEAAIDDTERMILEAFAARQDAEAVPSSTMKRSS